MAGQLEKTELLHHRDDSAFLDESGIRNIIVSGPSECENEVRDLDVIACLVDKTDTITERTQRVVETRENYASQKDRRLVSTFPAFLIMLMQRCKERLALPKQAFGQTSERDGG